MKKIAILGAVAAVVFSSCGTGAGSLKTEQDSLAYAVGLDFGNYVKGVDSTLDVNVIAAGIKAVLANDTTTMTREAAYNFMRDYFMVRKRATKPPNPKRSTRFASFTRASLRPARYSILLRNVMIPLNSQSIR